MTLKSSSLVVSFVADPRDRFLTSNEPWLRNGRRRFIALVIVVCLLHAALLAFLLLRDHNKPQVPPREIPVQVVVMPPPPPVKKQQQKPQPKEKQKPHREKPATDIPRTANNEKIKRENTADKTQAPTKAEPVPNAEMKPTPEKTKPASAAPKAAERTAAPPMPDDNKPDAETISKATPIKAPKPTEKVKKAKEKTLPSHDRASLAREFAALSESPHFSIAARAKPAPISGGHCDTSTYLCTLYALIMRQQHYSEHERALAMRGTAVVAFWLDDRGDLTHQALYRTSGFPELDREAVNAIRRAAPFPPPPPDQPHGFVAQMSFPAK
ncbi:energy transducer TonB [Methylovirgula sp. HY1]|uniref:energy transducer TonB n=1 Tax=Methylovirgula sp. HY1 TaxID=2822761 RepID=UPI001C5B24F9|nr:TonB family protein [Methylovirgula sp. HY1]